MIWGNTTDPSDPDGDASFAPTSAVPGVVFAGSVIGGFVRVYDAATGQKLASVLVGSAVASAGVVTDGILVVGAGVGERRENRQAPSDIASRVAENVTALCVPGTPHCPVLVAGKRLLVKDDARNTAKRKIVVLSKDKEALVVPEPGSPAAPTAGGGRLEITNPTTGASQIVDLPAANWVGIGRPAGSQGYSYKDGKGAAGPCRRVLVKKQKVLKATCQGDGIAFALGDAPQGSLRVALTTGTAPHTYCMLFGGTVTRDTAPTGRKAGLFRAKNAQPPGSCPSACQEGKTFGATFEGIQSVIFDDPVFGCTDTRCHSSVTPSAGLDLTAGASYAELVGVPSTADPALDRVTPGDDSSSVLYTTLAAATLGTPTVGSPMPIGTSPTPLTPQQLEAVRLWIRAGASESGIVEGTAALLGICLPAPGP